jgi:hypothetical protein
MKINNKDLNQILNCYSEKLSKKEQFYHVLRELKKHDSKLKKLKLKEDRPNHFKEEVCDVYILAGLLMQLEKVNQIQLNKASRHFANKIKEIYLK